MRILIITNLYPRPWAPHVATFNRQQFDHLARHASLLKVILLPWPEWLRHRHQCPQDDDCLFLPYFYLPRTGRRLTPFFQWLSLRFILPRLKDWRPDAILASWCYPDAVAAALLNRQLACPLYAVALGTDINESLNHAPRKRLLLRYLAKARRIICVSQALADKLAEHGMDREKLCVNYMGVDKQLFYPPDSKLRQGNQLLFVGNLIPTKGLWELVQAFERLYRQQPKLRLTIYGTGPLQGPLTDYLHRHGLAEAVRLQGARPLAEVADAMREADLLVLPSYREGVPNVILEAMACGLPVVATHVGGIPEVITPDCGILVAPQQSDALADAIERALQRHWQADAIARQASRFDWQKNVDTLLAIMQQEA